MRRPAAFGAGYPQANQHIMSGAIMGKDPKASVTDSFGITHDVLNLVIMGSSIFPTRGAVNPTYTIHALTLGAAEHVIQNWSVKTAASLLSGACALRACRLR